MVALNPGYTITARNYRGQPRNPRFWLENPQVMPPHVFAAAKLGLQPYEWQAAAMDAVGQRFPTAVCAANETGKTTYLIAPLILWFLDTYGAAGGKVVLTSGSWLQVQTQLAPAVRRFAHLFPEWRFLADEVKRAGKLDPQVIMFSTDSPGRAEGHHAVDADTAPLFIVVDEAKSVPDGIFEAFDRCGPQFLLIVSSPGQSSGKFYRMHTSESGLYWTRRVKSTDCPHLDPDKRERDLDLYGPRSPIFLSMHEAEFSEDAGSLILSPSDLQAAYEASPARAGGPRIAFCDFAAGGDENVLAMREGNQAWIESAWREGDTIQAARRFIQHFKRLGLEGWQVYADASGLGIVMCDALADEGFHVNRVNNGSPAQDPNYVNLGAEIWHQGARQIVRGKVSIPNEAVLWRQLTTRRSEQAPGGRLRAESKQDMSARGLNSPDRADALLGAIYCGPHMAGVIDPDQVTLAKPTYKRPTARF